PPPVARRRPRPRVDRTAGLPRAGRGPVPGAADRARGGAPGSAGVRGADRRRRGGGRTLPRRDAVVHGHPVIAGGGRHQVRRRRMTGFAQSVITIVLFILILGVLVVIHEVGHFVTARLANVRVLEFGIGFPPRAKVLRNKGETLYTLNWLPIGGFVKLEGEDGADPNATAPTAASSRTDQGSIASGFGTSGGVAYGAAATDPRSFAAQRYITKMLILVAGVAMNVLLAFVIFTGIAWLASPYVGLRFHEVQPDSPAATAGLQPGEAITAIDGERYQFITGPSALTGLRDRAGQTVQLTLVDQAGHERVVPVTLRSAEEISPQKGALGISGTTTP